MNLTFEYKLEPTNEQVLLMDEWLEVCRQVYNYALAERRDWIKSRKCKVNSCSIRSDYIIPVDAPKITYASQCKSLTQAKKNYPELTKVYSQVLQQVLNTVEKAFVGMWALGRGFPRFKKKARMRSFLFPQFSSTKDLSTRIHQCPECNYETNRDVASAQIVLKRGIAALGHRVKKSVEQGEETKPALKQKRSIAKSRSPRRPV